MRIVCPVKRVADTAARTHVNADFTIDRESAATMLNANDEWALEEAARIKESQGAHLVALCMGPIMAQQTARTAMAYGLDEAVQVFDGAIKGSDAVSTARVLAAAVAGQDADLVLMGKQSGDARTALVPAMLAEFLGWPGLTYARRIALRDGVVEVDRVTARGQHTAEAPLPAVVSVAEAIHEPREPGFDDVSAVKSKPFALTDLSSLGVEPDRVGWAGSHATALEVGPSPPRQPGEVVWDGGSGAEGAAALEEVLADRGVI